MSLLHAVVAGSRCRSTHQRLAVDALMRLQSPQAEDWRNLLLHHHDEYLKGAEAPDRVFKDFKNHVLHPREKDWGGAIEACQEWHRRTVRALKAKDWRQAAWSAGVLCHYYVDPLQPFHTAQTEEEGVIHRAFEWSCFRSYALLKTILEADFGYPDIEAPRSEKWLAQMVKDAAKAANAHYELAIEHYDLDAAVRDPKAGLDQDLRDAMARLIGHACVGFARILDRAFEEAEVKPPRTGGALQAMLLAAEAPLLAGLKAIDDAMARREIEAQRQEYRRTGKVRGTLREEEKVVRALHAAEVLKTPLSSLDAKWPKEIGAKHGEGAPMRGRSRRPAPRVERKIRAVAVKPEPAPAAPKLAKAQQAKPVPRELPHGAPLPKKDKTLPRFTLNGGAPVVQAPSIGAKAARRLEAVGVKTVADLLALKPEDGESRIDARDVSAQTIRNWQAQALLACTVPGLKSREAQALAACGVTDAAELAELDAEELCEAVANWGLTEEGQRAWGSAPAPTPDDVATWIERAKRVTRPHSFAA
jgi:hypothetical protein